MATSACDPILNALNACFQNMENKFQNVNVKLDTIEKKIQNLEKEVQTLKNNTKQYQIIPSIEETVKILESLIDKYQFKEVIEIVGEYEKLPLPNFQKGNLLFYKAKAFQNSEEYNKAYASIKEILPGKARLALPMQAKLVTLQIQILNKLKQFQGIENIIVQNKELLKDFYIPLRIRAELLLEFCIAFNDLKDSKEALNFSKNHLVTFISHLDEIHLSRLFYEAGFAAYDQEDSDYLSKLITYTDLYSINNKTKAYLLLKIAKNCLSRNEPQKALLNMEKCFALSNDLASITGKAEYPKYLITYATALYDCKKYSELLTWIGPILAGEVSSKNRMKLFKLKILSLFSTKQYQALIQEVGTYPDSVSRVDANELSFFKVRSLFLNREIQRAFDESQSLVKAPISAAQKSELFYILVETSWHLNKQFPPIYSYLNEALLLNLNDADKSEIHLQYAKYLNLEKNHKEAKNKLDLVVFDSLPEESQSLYHQEFKTAIQSKRRKLQ